MAYPESSAVSAGDATLASHYNNLRLDSLYLGKAAADAVALGTLLERFETRLEVERLGTDKIRVPASAVAPVSIVIDGYPCQAVANVDLDAGEVPSGGASVYYIFANRADSSTTFTLTVSTSSTEAASQRRIGRFYWDGSAIVKDSVRSEFACLITELLYFVDPQLCNGRLTLSTGVPVPTSDISSSATVYFTPYAGNIIALYVNDYGWRTYTFSELTLDISGLSDATNYDIFIYDNAGTLTLSATAWSNDTLRATALVKQDGVYCKTGALEYRYLGTIRMSGAGTSCDTEEKRYCWNYYNRVPHSMYKMESTASWTYGTGTWRQVNAASTNQLDLVIGVDEDCVYVSHHGNSKAGSSGESGRIAIGLDETDTVVTGCVVSRIVSTAASFRCDMVSFFFGHTDIGYHYLAALEYGGTGTLDFYGDDLHQSLQAVIYG